MSNSNSSSSDTYIIQALLTSHSHSEVFIITFFNSDISLTFFNPTNLISLNYGWKNCVKDPLLQWKINCINYINIKLLLASVYGRLGKILLRNKIGKKSSEMERHWCWQHHLRFFSSSSITAIFPPQIFQLFKLINLLFLRNNI